MAPFVFLLSCYASFTRRSQRPRDGPPGEFHNGPHGCSISRWGYIYIYPTPFAKVEIRILARTCAVQIRHRRTRGFSRSVAWLCKLRLRLAFGGFAVHGAGGGGAGGVADGGGIGGSCDCADGARPWADCSRAVGGGGTGADGAAFAPASAALPVRFHLTTWPCSSMSLAATSSSHASASSMLRNRVVFSTSQTA